MAWAGIVIGMVAGICAAVVGYTAVGMPLWLSLLMYPATGTTVAVLVIAALLLRDLPAGPSPRQFSEAGVTATA
jgi:hypothetical protein